MLSRAALLGATSQVWRDVSCLPSVTTEPLPVPQRGDAKVWGAPAGPGAPTYLPQASLVSHYLSFVKMQYGRRRAQLIWHCGVGIIFNQCRRFSLQVHACSHRSWLGRILSQHARFGDWRLIRLSVFGHESVKSSCLGTDWWGSFSKGLDWGGTIPLKAWIGAGPSLLEAGLSLFGIGQSHHRCAVIGLRISLHLYSLCGPGLGRFM